jgi:uncharacterized membrane protein YfcA
VHITNRLNDLLVHFFVLIYPLIGLLSGFLAGLLGIGGGLIIVPALLLIFPYQGVAAAVVTHTAIATSLATVVVTSLIATYSHHRHGAVDWPIFRRMTPGLFGGALVGALVTSHLPGETLRVLFGLFALMAALQMGLQLQPASQGRLPAAPWMAVAGAVIGILSALVGVGGGTITVPFLRWSNVIMQRAVATSSACGFPIAAGACLGFTLTDGIAGGTAVVNNAIYWPAALWIAAASLVAVPVGARFTHRISISSLSRIFAVTLAIIGLRLILVKS